MRKIPSWALAILWFFLNAVLLAVSGRVLMALNIPQGYVLADVLVWITHDLLVAIGCYIIVKWNPKSLWYVPVICNLYGIIGFIMIPDFRTSYMCILTVTGWALSIMASIIGYRIGRRSLPGGVNEAK